MDKRNIPKSIAIKVFFKAQTLGNNFSLDPLKIYKTDGYRAYFYRVERGLVSFIYHH